MRKTMSTRCLIAIEDGDGKCRSIYCHHDGYPEGVGACLKESYTTREGIEALLALGDLSSLSDDLEKCYAYHRDGGEVLYEPTVWDNRDVMSEKAYDFCWAEYVYVFSNGEWLVSKWNAPKTWRKLAEIETL